MTFDDIFADKLQAFAAGVSVGAWTLIVCLVMLFVATSRRGKP